MWTAQQQCCGLEKLGHLHPCWFHTLGGQRPEQPSLTQQLSTSLAPRSLAPPQVPELPYVPVKRTVHTNIYAYIFNSRIKFLAKA